MSTSTSETERERGIVYILSNPAMPDYIKIGRTDGNTSQAVLKRMKYLDVTSTPRPFHCEAAAVVADPIGVEKALHTIFGDRRIRENREFFEGVSVVRARAALDLVKIKDVTPSGGTPELNAAGAVVEEKPPRRPPFSFSKANVPAGAILTWAYESSITCEVVNDRQVRYDGKLYMLSPLAQQLLGAKWSPQGTAYWLYEEETLDERRKRLEDEEAGSVIG